jgi:hypothetical protein
MGQQAIKQMAEHQGGGLARIEMTADQPPADQRRHHGDQRYQPGSDEGGELCGNEIGQRIGQLDQQLQAAACLLGRDQPDRDEGKQQRDR